MGIKKKPHGFTLVELLIVIVVISILAAISIVAYNGIQNRAKQAKIESATRIIRQAAYLYKVDNGSYPDTGNSSACIGTAANYPAISGYAAGACAPNISGDVPQNVSTSVNAMFLSYIGSIPDGSTDVVTLYGGRGSRGITYDYYKASIGARPSLSYYLPGDTPCYAQYTSTYMPSYRATSCLQYIDNQ